MVTAVETLQQVIGLRSIIDSNLKIVDAGNFLIARNTSLWHCMLTMIVDRLCVILEGPHDVYHVLLSWNQITESTQTIWAHSLNACSSQSAEFFEGQSGALWPEAERGTLGTIFIAQAWYT